jgi:signal peptidase I
MPMKRRENIAAMLACDLAGEVVRTFGEVRLRVFGTSMVPSILPGDLICVQRAGVSEISTGEIVLYSRDGRMFAHRVVNPAGGAEKALLITRGDRLRDNDPPVFSSELLGRVTSVERGNFQKRPAIRLNGWERLIAGLLRHSDQATYLYVQFLRFLQQGGSNERQQSAGSRECQV